MSVQPARRIPPESFKHRPGLHCLRITDKRVLQSALAGSSSKTPVHFFQVVIHLQAKPEALTVAEIAGQQHRRVQVALQRGARVDPHLAAALGATGGVGGALISATQPHVPTGPTIVLCATALVVVSLVAAPHRGLLARLRRRRRLEAPEMR